VLHLLDLEVCKNYIPAFANLMITRARARAIAASGVDASGGGKVASASDCAKIHKPAASAVWVGPLGVSKCYKLRGGG
jgi:hypothetical protein